MKSFENQSGADFSIINTVLFDFDGTLLDSYDLIADSWRSTAMRFASRDLSDDEVISTLGEMLIDSMRRLFPEADAEAAVEYFRAYQKEIFLDRIRLFDGAEELLRALKKAGYKNALVTSRMRASTYRALEKFGIGDLFEAVITASDTEKFKPDPEPIFTILDMIGSKPEESIIVGDSAQDIEAGKNAGTFTALVDWSVALPDGEIRENAAAPDVMIYDLRDILALLGVRG